jgi:2,5-diamino-6-(ribosylamino)-4(3H)-pyrimidinone 5'-phosphate reductase
VDAGGHLVGALLRAGLVDEVSVVIEPRLVGGESPRWLVQAPDAGPGEAIPLQLRSLERFDDGALWLRYDVARR